VVLDAVAGGLAYAAVVLLGFDRPLNRFAAIHRAAMATPT
jgi:hypothetical protein